MFMNKVPRTVFGCEREVIGEWRKLCGEKLQLNSLAAVVTAIK
jgi:hypothetical protein